MIRDEYLALREVYLQTTGDLAMILYDRLLDLVEQYGQEGWGDLPTVPAPNA